MLQQHAKVAKQLTVYTVPEEYPAAYVAECARQTLTVGAFLLSCVPCL